jgi:hypothetical protein
MDGLPILEVRFRVEQRLMAIVTFRFPRGGGSFGIAQNCPLINASYGKTLIQKALY